MTELSEVASVAMWQRDEPSESPKIRIPGAEAAVVIDQNAVAELVALMSKSEQNVFFTEFCEDMTAYIGVVESVKTAADVGRARDAMHALAGAALIIGANKLAETARRIEKTDPGAVVMKRSELMDDLIAVCEETAAEISRLFLSASRFE